MKKILFSLTLALAASLFADAPAPKNFNVKEFGATGDGKTFDTAAIQKALDTCGKVGGTVQFPPGTYLSKPLTLGTQTTVQLDKGATLLASSDQNDFMKTPGDWTKAKGSDFISFISGKELTGVSFTGAGVIDGNGKVWWEEAEKARQKVSGFTLPRPNLLTLNRCTKTKLTGITLQNSPKFHFVPTDCEDLVIEGVTVLAPEHAANTDGIDPSNCRNVTFTKCTFDTGDDDIAIKSGKKVEGREFGVENITVTDCIFKHGHGMSIGSETVGGVHNVTVKNCTFEDTDNGLRIKSRRERGGRVENITYENCTIKNCHPAISIMTYYQNSTHDKFPKDDKAQPMTDTTPQFKNITIKNITGNSTKEAGLIVGLPESPIENVTLENVTLSGKEGLTIANAKSVVLKNVKITPESGDPIVLFNTTGEGLPEAKK
jgi:polygalacturonase